MNIKKLPKILFYRELRVMGRGGVEPPTHEFSVHLQAFHNFSKNKALCLS